MRTLVRSAPCWNIDLISGRVLLILAVLVAAIAAFPAGAIHRGYDAPIGSFRFMVSLRLAETPDSHRCGGTLISTRKLYAGFTSIRTD